MQNNLLENRVGLVISKKVSIKATVRNKVRRRMKAVLMEILQEKPGHTDVVIVALPGIEKRTFLEIKHSINQIFKRI